MLFYIEFFFFFTYSHKIKMKINKYIYNQYNTEQNSLIKKQLFGIVLDLKWTLKSLFITLVWAFDIYPKRSEKSAIEHRLDSTYRQVNIDYENNKKCK